MLLVLMIFLPLCVITRIVELWFLQKQLLKECRLSIQKFFLIAEDISLNRGNARFLKRI